MTDATIGLAPYHIPTVLSGEYNVKANINNDINRGIEQNIKFHVAGYNVSIPQNEILAVYPPVDHTGDFAGTFPHIQFKRSTLPWEYKVNQTDIEEERLPYIFLLLLKEDELKDSKIINTDSKQLKDSTESIDEPKPLKVLKFNNSELFPKVGLIKNLAHVRVQNHTEIKDLNISKETSILVSHRMVEPDTKYRAFICYYTKKDRDKFVMVDDLSTNTSIEYAIILNEWSFESIGAELYQVDPKKLEKNPCIIAKDEEFKTFNWNFLKDLGPIDINSLKIQENAENKVLFTLIKDNENYLEALKNIKSDAGGNIQKVNLDTWIEFYKGIFKDLQNKFDKNKEKYTLDEFQEIVEQYNNHILEYLQYNGKNLKGYLHELELQPFKSSIKSPTIKENSFKEDIEKDAIKKLLDISKVPLEHQLKAGGKMVSWYQGPFTNWNYSFNILDELNRQCIKDVPDHQDYLNLFNEDTGMYDMTYSAAWQLGRLMIMNENKVLQELKKWKYELELYNLVNQQNGFSHLSNINFDAPKIPDLVINYISELIQFRNFPLYYLLPHEDLSTDESIKNFKIDNSWILAFLFGIFSAGPKLSREDFENYVLKEEKLKSAFNNTTEYYGILLQSQTIKNWPHLVVELNESHDFHYVTSINESLRLYVVSGDDNDKISSIEMYLKNENAHFGCENMKLNEENIILNNKNYTIKNLKGIDSSVVLANKLLYKQPKVKFVISTPTSD